MSAEQATGSHTPASDPTRALETPSVPDRVTHSHSTEVRRLVRETSLICSPHANPLTFANQVAGARNDGDPAGQSDDDSAKRISAYARLDFESFTFYVQTLQVILGRRPENDAGNSMVDVHLGPAKAISRRHAKIFYNFAAQRFEITVMGRNGAFVGDQFVEPNSTVPLWDSTRVQIGQIIFTFVLPNVPLPPSENGAPRGKEDFVTSLKSGDPERGSPAPRKGRRSSSAKLEDGDENNFFAVRAASNNEKSSATPSARTRKPRREYKLEEIPPEYRTKPSYSYSHLIATALESRAPHAGLSLADIYEAIMDLYPYYRYCQPGWQNSVRHNLSSSKAFQKVSKEGKGWLWGIDEVYVAEREAQKQRAAAKAAQLQQRAGGSPGGHQKTIAELAQEIPQRESPSLREGQIKGAAGLSPDTVQLLAALQQGLQAQLAKAGQPHIDSQLLTNALAVVIAQAAKQAGGIGSLNTVLKDPQAAQRLLVQALELMKRQAQAKHLGAAQTPHQAVDSARKLEQKGSTGAQDQRNVEGSTKTTEAFASEHTAPNRGFVATGLQSPASKDEKAVPNIAAQQEPSVAGAFSSHNISNPATAAETDKSQPAGQAAGQKAPLTLEEISRLLSQAEKIANPTPNIRTAIERLRAHQRMLLSKRSTTPQTSDVEQPRKKTALG